MKMKMSITLEFDVRECKPGGAYIDGLLRLDTMSDAELEDRISNGFRNLLGSQEDEDVGQLDNMMFDGEDHLLVVRNVTVTSIKIA